MAVTTSSCSLAVRPYEPGDERDIVELFHLVFPKHNMDETIWAWRFKNNPDGSGVIYLSWDGNVLAAHYAVTSTLLRINGRDWLTGLSGDTMTHPNYRGRGLFNILAQSTYKRMSQAGMGAVWGFPNALSHRGFIRDLAWTDIYEVPMLRLSMSQPSTLPTPSSQVRELRGFDSRFDQLWDWVKDDYSVIARRSQRYLHWRYVENPREQYRILAFVDTDDEIRGYAVFKKYNSELQVVDILVTRDISVGVQLVSRVAELAATDSMTSVSLCLNVAHPLHHELEKHGFRNGEAVTYFGARVLQTELQGAGIYDFRNWYFTMGDSDVF